MFSVDLNKLKIENIRQTDVKNESEWINILHQSTFLHLFFQLKWVVLVRMRHSNKLKDQNIQKLWTMLNNHLINY